MALRIGDYTLDTLRHVLNGPACKDVQLSPLASQLLQELAQRPGELFERADLVKTLWRGDWSVGDPALSRVVSEIRKAIGDDPRTPALIQTVPRRGYRLVSRAPSAESNSIERDLQRLERLWKMALFSVLAIGGVLGGLLLLASLARSLR